MIKYNCKKMYSLELIEAVESLMVINGIPLVNRRPAYRAPVS